MDEKLLSKLEKLIAVRDGATNRGEIEAAGEAIARLVARYNLDQSDLERVARIDRTFEKPEIVLVDSNFLWSKRRLVWLIKLASIVSDVFSTRALSTPYTVTFIGRKERAEASLIAWRSLAVQMGDIALEETRKQTQALKEKYEVRTVRELSYLLDYSPKAWSGDFTEGMLSGLLQKTREAQKEVDPDGRSTALVVQLDQEIDEKISEVFGKIGTYQASGRDVDWGAYSSGRKVGKNLSVSAGIETGSTHEGIEA